MQKKTRKRPWDFWEDQSCNNEFRQYIFVLSRALYCFVFFVHIVSYLYRIVLSPGHPLITSLLAKLYHLQTIIVKCRRSMKQPLPPPLHRHHPNWSQKVLFIICFQQRKWNTIYCHFLIHSLFISIFRRGRSYVFAQCS